jgi:hypothetical protein
MDVIKVPKTPKSAYNPRRPASDLLKAQVEHLEAASNLPGDAARRRRRPRTEGEAAKYIEELTRTLHPAGGATTDRMLEAPSPTGPARRRRRTKSARPKKKADRVLRSVPAKSRAAKKPVSGAARRRKVRGARRKTR